MAWPPSNTEPTAEMPYFHNGKYSKNPLQVSPEGNLRGDIQWVCEIEHKIWWTGSQYQYIEVVGQAESVAALPSGPRKFGEIWRALTPQQTGAAKYQEYWWDAENAEWKLLRWLWTVDSFDDLPYPGVMVGAAHKVVEEDVPTFWDGFQWALWRHSMLKDDQPSKHLPAGFIQYFVPDAALTWINARELELLASASGSGTVMINGQIVNVGPECAVFTTLPALLLGDGVIVPTHLEPDTEYWVYLANRTSEAFVVEALAGDETHGATPAWDFRGKLFLSPQASTNQFWARTGLGRNARIVGKIQTGAMSGGYPTLRRELNLSLIDNPPSLIEAFRDYSDYVVEFVGPTQLTLKKLDGMYGQIGLPGGLRCLTFDQEIYNTDAWLRWDDEVDGKLIRMTQAILSDHTYYLYLAADIDAFNFNATNPNTRRPWQESDVGAENNYDPSLDLRLKAFLSDKLPDHGRMSEEWPGYYTRHIGIVRTDANGRFINSRDISAIRQPTLAPVYFDGLAECTFVKCDATEFRLARKEGTSGVVNVGGLTVQTYSASATDSVHRVRTTDIIQVYDEDEPDGPLTDDVAVSSHPGEIVYLYLANNQTLWGNHANRTFLTQTPPTNGYLSRNWPGNQARWMASVYVDSSGKFTGAFLVDSIAKISVIDDTVFTVDNSLSAAYVKTMFDRIWARIDATELFEQEKASGCGIILELRDTSGLQLRSVSGAATIIFPDLTSIEIDEQGIGVDFDQADPDWWNEVMRVYLTNDGSLQFSMTDPDAMYPKLRTLGNDKVLVGWALTNLSGTADGPTSAFSYWNEPVRKLAEISVQWNVSRIQHFQSTEVIEEHEYANDLPKLLLPDIANVATSRSGRASFYAVIGIENVGDNQSVGEVGTLLDAFGLRRDLIYVPGLDGGTYYADQEIQAVSEFSGGQLVQLRSIATFSSDWPGVRREYVYLKWATKSHNDCIVLTRSSTMAA